MKNLLVQDQQKKIEQNTNLKCKRRLKQNIFLGVIVWCLISCVSEPPIAIEKPAAEKRRELLASLPMPRHATYFDIAAFRGTYAEMYRRYEPLEDEYRLFFNTYESGDPTSSDSLFLRFCEDPEKTFWVFIYGADLLLKTLTVSEDRAPRMLFSDKQDFFIRNIAVLLFIAKLLDGAERGKQNLQLVQNMYIFINKNVFGRDVKIETPLIEKLRRKMDSRINKP